MSRQQATSLGPATQADKDKAIRRIKALHAEGKTYKEVARTLQVEEVRLISFSGNYLDGPWNQTRANHFALSCGVHRLPTVGERAERQVPTPVGITDTDLLIEIMMVIELDRPDERKLKLIRKILE